ncbi:MFS transporter [Candidatus Legionella polyplacis]|uniref:MFS transporter n=1 Tax=Candidatus Legionella polyplacis TaxID=2005262 RepID=A0ABZ2GXW4_9GAMM
MFRVAKRNINFCFKKKLSLVLFPWFICICGSLFFFYEFIQGNMFSSIADNVMRDFCIHADKMAYLSSIYYVSNVCFLPFAGGILNKYSVKKIILLSMLICIISIFCFSYTKSFYLALICRFVMGIGSAFCFLSPIRLASNWIVSNKMALATGFIVTIGMVGGIFSQYPLTKLVIRFGWRNALLIVAWFGVFILLIMYLGIIDRKDIRNNFRKNNTSFFCILKKVYCNFYILRAALYTSLMNMVVAVFGAMIGTIYLMRRMNVIKEVASSINTMLFLGIIFGSPIIGWISDMLKLRIIVMQIGAILSFIVSVFIFFYPVSLFEMKLLFFLLGFFTASQIISYAFVSELGDLEISTMSVSVVSTITQGSYVVYQNIFSFLLMYCQKIRCLKSTFFYSIEDYRYAILIIPFGMIIAFFILFGLKEINYNLLEER